MKLFTTLCHRGTIATNAKHKLHRDSSSSYTLSKNHFPSQYNFCTMFPRRPHEAAAPPHPHLFLSNKNLMPGQMIVIASVTCFTLTSEILNISDHFLGRGQAQGKKKFSKYNKETG